MYTASTYFEPLKGTYVLKTAYNLQPNTNNNAYQRALTTDEITVTADGTILPLSKTPVQTIDSFKSDSMTGIAQVWVDSIPGLYEDYDPDIYLSVGYYKKVTVPALVPSASITDVTVNGTVGTKINSQKFTINANDFTFVSGADMAKWASIDGNSFEKCINLPKGLEITYSSSDDTFATFEVSGTPAEPMDQVFKITIPWELTKDLKEDIEVTLNENAKWAIANSAQPAENITPSNTETNPDTSVNEMFAVWIVVFMISISTAGFAALKLKGKIN